MSTPTQCPELQAIDSETQDLSIGLAFVGGNDTDITQLQTDVAKRKAEHLQACPVCNQEHSTTHHCNWVDVKMEEYREVRTGLIAGYADYQTAEQLRITTLNEIELHLDECPACRKSFKQYISEFL